MYQADSLGHRHTHIQKVIRRDKDNRDVSRKMEGGDGWVWVVKKEVLGEKTQSVIIEAYIHMYVDFLWFMSWTPQYNQPC